MIPPFHPGNNYPSAPYGAMRGGRGRGNGFREGRNGGRNGGRGAPCTGRGYGGAQCGQRKNVSHYCWTHGACSHPSWYCENPAFGHNWYATFDNRMGGSNAHCTHTT